MIGMGVMINRLSGNRETVESFTKAIGKTISSIRIDNNVLCIDFDDGYKIQIYDDGQSCCETRYMSTDDDLQYYVGSKLVTAELKDGESKEDDYETHDIEFLDIHTDRGVFTMVNHNEHNGYYGGFSVVVRGNDA